MTSQAWQDQTGAGPSRAIAAEGFWAPDGLDARTPTLRWAVPLVLAALLAFMNSLFLDGDTGWHLGSGQWILANGAVPVVDPFSHSFGGTPWTAHEWLAQVAMAGVKNVAGWSGLALLFAAVMALTAWLMLREALRYLPARWALGMVIVGLGVLLPFALARPHMLAWPLLAGWTLILIHARERQSAPPLTAALLMTIWANAHASYIVAFGLVGLFALESLIENRRDMRLLLRWVGFGFASLAAALITPFGPSHFIYPFEVSGMGVLSIIGEWRRSVPTTDMLFYACLAALIPLIWRRWRMIPPLRLLLLAGISVMAIMHARHQMLFVCVGFFLVLPWLRPGVTPAPLPARREGRGGMLIAGLILLGAARLLVPERFEESSVYPLSLIAQIPADIRAQPVINEYSQGGPLIMLGVKPFIDGRADMYGDDFTFRAKAITDGNLALFREDAARFSIGWVLLRTGNGLVPKLAREPGWRIYARDAHAVVFVRDTGAGR